MKNKKSDVIPSLAEKYREYFNIGAAVTPGLLKTNQELIKKHFSSLTAENEMKPISINPKEGEYSFKKADVIIDFASENNKLVRGHTLLWHKQTSDHIFLGEDGFIVKEDVLRQRLKRYMKKIFDHFSDKVYCWDVVNEAVEDKLSSIYRMTKWLEVLGEDYIDDVFIMARELNPHTQLFYNDYNAVLPEKRDKIYDLLKGMKERHVPIDGIGIQAHWNIYDFTYDEIKRAIEKYASLDLKIHITELDVSVFGRKDGNPGLEKPTDKMLEMQNEFYENIFLIFREYRDVIRNVTFWGISDEYTWLDNFPLINRKNWPLLFDTNNRPKEAFWRVVDF